MVTNSMYKARSKSVVCCAVLRCVVQVHEDDGSVAAAAGAPVPLSFNNITGPDGIAGKQSSSWFAS